MTVYSQFRKHFSSDNLTDIYIERITYSNATGLDNQNQHAFRKHYEQQIEIVSRKIISGTYKLTKYKLKLVSKGRGKYPREISIPTIRDRIAIRALCDFLKERFRPSLNPKLPQNIISLVKKDIHSGMYSGCIKLDVADFYPSIAHTELLSRLRRRIKDTRILGLIESCLATPTVSLSRHSDISVSVGVPQGLAISNILAEIYLINIDKHMQSKPNISYFRFVDDVLIFCDLEDAENLAKEVILKFKKIGLKIHDPLTQPEKSSISDIANKFDYLGYQFYETTITARTATVDKLRSSIVAIFTGYKHSATKDVNFLLWRLNLRITGCVFENKSKGWLFFFSEINDETLLHALDNFIVKISNRFGVGLTPKKFARAFKELTHRKYETSYIPNFDNYDIEEQKSVLSTYFSFDLTRMSEADITFEFRKRIGKQVKDLQEDIKDFNY